MYKKSLLLGVVSGLLAGITSLIYQHVYKTSLGVDFTDIVRPVNIISACLIGGILASTGYWILDKWLKSKGEIVFNLIFVILSFATILGPITMKLPLTVDSPELFPGLVVPMHFFPALGWLTLKPLFIQQNKLQEG